MEWTKVEDGLPEDGITVLVATLDGVKTGFMTSTKSWYNVDFNSLHPFAWMPIPEYKNN